MHTHWDDTPFDEFPSHPASAEAAGSASADRSPSPPPAFVEDAKVPFMKLQGRWLRQMGFNVGSKLKIDAAEGVITISIIGNPVMPQNGVPRSLERKIHFTEVEADTSRKVLSGEPR